MSDIEASVLNSIVCTINDGKLAHHNFVELLLIT